MCVQQGTAETQAASDSTSWGGKMSIEVNEHEVCDAVEAVDAEAGIVRGVKLLGLRSGNRNPDGSVGRVYDTVGVQESAAKLFPGARVYIDHPENPGATRRYADAFGVVENHRYVPGKGHFGDLRYNTSHRLAAQFAEDVKKFPRGLGFSINAAIKPAKSKAADGSLVVESLEFLRSVDVVTRPATAVGVFEHTDPAEAVAEGGPQVDVKQLETMLETMKVEQAKTSQALEAAMAENTRLKADAEQAKIAQQVTESFGKLLSGGVFESVDDAKKTVAGKFRQDAIECACQMSGDLRMKFEQMLKDAGPLFVDDETDITAGADDEKPAFGNRDASEGDGDGDDDGWKAPAIGKRAAGGYSGLRVSLGMKK